MITLLYIIVVCVVCLYCYGIAAQYRLIGLIARVVRNANIPLLVDGRTIKAFSVERTEVVATSKTVAIDMITYCGGRFLGLFGLQSSKLYNLYIQYARTLCYADLCEQAHGMSYILNIHEHVLHPSGRTITIFAYGNAVLRYADSLAVYKTTADIPTILRKRSTLPVFRRMGVAAATLIVLVTIVKLSTDFISKRMVENFPTEEEEILWGYIKDSFVDAHQRVDLKGVQQEWQGLLDGIPPRYLPSEYRMKVHIEDRAEPDIELYPGGNIVVTRGFVERLQYKNQALFALTHMSEHCRNKDHIKRLQRNIINFKLLTSLFGKDSWIAKMLVWRSAFDHAYTEESELVSDASAVDVLQYKFGHVFGSDVFERAFYRLADSTSDIWRSHPLNAERTEGLYNYIIRKNYTFGQGVELESKIESISQSGSISAIQSSKNDDFVSLFNQYRADMNQQYVRYQEFLRTFNEVLQFNMRLTFVELEEKNQRLLAATNDITNYEDAFTKIIHYYDKQFTELIENTSDAKLQEEFRRDWVNERDTVLMRITFYLERDKGILESQHIILQFLKNRFGSYKVLNDGIEFQTDKEKADYEVLRSRLEELMRKTLPDLVPEEKIN